MSDAVAPSPEIGTLLQVGSVLTNYHDCGKGRPVLLIHGSGPGVSAWANWRTVLPRLKQQVRVIAPDMAGFGYSQVESEVSFDLDLWLGQLTGLLDVLVDEPVTIIGNSFGGALALHLASRFPERVNRLVLMGAVGTQFKLTSGLDKVWGYSPSIEAMHELVQTFAHDQRIVTDDLVQLRYRASIRADVHERFAQLFPAPRQRWIDRLAVDDDALRQITVPALILHGRDDQVIPLGVSQRLATLLPTSELVVFDHCGHWVQIEQTEGFVQAVSAFLEADRG